MENIIMIVDDLKMNIDFLAKSLDDKYVIMPAVGGKKAIEMFERKKPDLVLLDVSMPDVDGFEVLNYMKEKASLANIPVIFITGFNDLGAEKKGLQMGAVDFIKKPCSTLIVRSKVQNHLELKAYRDELEDLVNMRKKQIDASREAIIMGMSLMSDKRGGVDGEHIERIKKYTRLISDKLMELYPEMIEPDMLNRITMFSPLHDIGKTGISDSILKKNGLLTPEEFEIMKEHTVEGAQLLKKTEYLFMEVRDGGDLKTAIEIAECHHEKFDGSGYPYGLKGEEIPVPARIVSIADVYDALRSKRQYKKAFTHEEALNEINGDGERTNRKHFDPRVLEAFMLVQDEIKKMYDYA